MRLNGLIGITAGLALVAQQSSCMFGNDKGCVGLMMVYADHGTQIGSMVSRRIRERLIWI